MIQILNKENIALQINDVDQEICNLWGVEFKEKFYAAPKTEVKMYLPSWFDTLCKFSEIEKQSLNPEKIKEKYLKPYIDMNHIEWNNLSLEEKMNDLYQDLIVSQYLKVLDYWIKNEYTIEYIAD